jgi:hypothetical protein
VTLAILDDHLLRDLLADAVVPALRKLLVEYEPATTNHYLYRLARSVVAARGGALTGAWSVEQRRALGARLVDLPPDIEVVPMRQLAVRMAEIAGEHRVSTLGAEAVAAVEHLEGALCVWSGDDGPSIRAAVRATGHRYVTVRR